MPRELRINPWLCLPGRFLDYESMIVRGLLFNIVAIIVSFPRPSGSLLHTTWSLKVITLWSMCGWQGWPSFVSTCSFCGISFGIMRTKFRPSRKRHSLHKYVTCKWPVNPTSPEFRIQRLTSLVGHSFISLVTDQGYLHTITVLLLLLVLSSSSPLLLLFISIIIQSRISVDSKNDGWMDSINHLDKLRNLPRGRYSPIFAIQGCAAGKGTVFRQFACLCLEQGIYSMDFQPSPSLSPCVSKH